MLGATALLLQRTGRYAVGLDQASRIALPEIFPPARNFLAELEVDAVVKRTLWIWLALLLLALPGSTAPCGDEPAAGCCCAEPSSQVVCCCEPDAGPSQSLAPPTAPSAEWALSSSGERAFAPPAPATLAACQVSRPEPRRADWSSPQCAERAPPRCS